jgi:predicted Zn-dependent protease
MSATGTANNQTKTGDINVKACNKNGIEYADLIMEGVNYSSEYNFNLFSISKSLKKGWKLNGHTNCITLTSPSGDSNIIFDIVIPTAQGCIFATMLVRDSEITATNVKTEKEKSKLPKIPTMTFDISGSTCKAGSL